MNGTITKPLAAIRRTQSYRDIAKALWTANPISKQILGICSALAVTVQLKTALVMSLALTAVVAFSSLAISSIRTIIPRNIRIIVEVAIIATLVILADELLKKASETLAALLGKPERYVMVINNYNPQMLFAGENTPLAYLELKSIGLPSDRTAELSKALCDLVSHQMQVPHDRIYIEFSDAQRHLWGWNGSTF